MRIVLVAVCALVLGMLQVVSAVALRAAASPASLPHAAPAALVRAIDALPPSALEPQALRWVLGSAALARGDLARAASFAQSLHDDAQRDVLLAGIAERRGDRTEAVADYLAAGDVTALQTQIDALATAGHVAAAIDLETALLERLAARRAQNDTIAEAEYHLGLLDQARAYQFPASAAEHARDQFRSRDAYATALRLAPLEERYALALANQDLNVGDLAAARALFSRVHDLDPSSADPYTGLADAAIRAHDPQTARAELDAAERIAPGSAAIASLRSRLPR
jgi:tetratricopeptide (TPR) repeat protein